MGKSDMTAFGFLMMVIGLLLGQLCDDSMSRETAKMVVGSIVAGLLGMVVGITIKLWEVMP